MCVAKDVAADYVYQRGCLGKKVFNLTRLLAAMKGKVLNEFFYLFTLIYLFGELQKQSAYVLTAGMKLRIAYSILVFPGLFRTLLTEKEEEH